MQLSWEPLDLRLVDPFRIAHGVSTVRENVLVRIDGGLGEAAAVNYLGETRSGIIAYLRRPDLLRGADPRDLAAWGAQLPAGSAAARAAIDMALYDLWGRQLGQPIYRLLGLDPTRIAPTSLTIAIGAPEWMAARAREADSEILKLKLGAAGDELRLEAVRAATPARLRVDANGGWTLPAAKRLLPLLVEHGVELVEQPLPAGDLEGLRELSRLRSRPKLFVDESIASVADIAAHAGCVEGVVIKLAKCGGVSAARAQIERAREHGLEVMLGCMIESSLAVTAAAHLAPLADHVDLDGPLLITFDPFEGVRYARGRLSLPAAPGLGVELRDGGRPGALTGQNPSG